MSYWVILVTWVLVGLLIGSFLNVVIYRGPKMWNLVESDSPGNLVSPRSYCPSCKAPIKRINMIPLLGYIMLHGKCASCSASISLRYPLVELLGAAAAVIATILFGFTVTAALAALFIWTLIALSFIDAETGFLPDALTIPLLALGIVANAIDLFATLPNALIGATAGYLIFRLIGAVFQRLRGLEGLGQGDAKLLGALGAWLGWQALAPLVFAGAVLALAAVGTMRLSGKTVSNETPIPFGPALAGAGAIAMILNGLHLPANIWN
jgi:leader peptidase (prepilin peptidase)/N-methyltransferase